MTYGPAPSKPFVIARYHQAAGTLQSFSSTVEAAVNYDTKDYDTGVGLGPSSGFVAGQGSGFFVGTTNSFVTTGSGWFFVCPSAGFYRVSAAIAWASITWATTDSAQMDLYRSANAGSSYTKWSTLASLQGWAAIASAFSDMRGSDVILCAKGDYLQVQAVITHSGGNTLQGDATRNWVVIEEVG